jgi:type I restriction enzyme S subunit
MDKLNELPSGWQWVKLEDLFDITSSKRVFESEWTKTGVPFYRAREIVKLSNHGFVNNELFISEEMFDEYSHKYGIPKEGDIMVTGVGTLGICYVVRPNDKFYFKDGNIIWFKKKDDVNVDSYFVQHAFQTDFVRNQIDNTAGSTVGTYTIIRAKNTLIPLPPLPEQQRLAKLLTEKLAFVEQAKQKIEAQVEAAEQLTSAYLREVFESDEYQNELLKDVCHINPSRKPIKRNDEELTSFVPMAAINEKIGQITKMEQQRFGKVKKGYTYFEENDVVFAKITPCMENGKTAIARNLIDGFGFGTTEFHVLRASEKITPEWIYFFVRQSKFLNEAAKNFTGSVGQQRVPKEFLENSEIPLPPIEKQKELATYLSEKIAIVEQLKTTLLAQLENVNQIPSALLKQAFNGQL